MSTINTIGLLVVLFLVMLIMGICRWLCVFCTREKNTYPTAYEVAKASDEQICEWVEDLDFAETASDLTIMNLIIERYLAINKIENV